MHETSEGGGKAACSEDIYNLYQTHGLEAAFRAFIAERFQGMEEKALTDQERALVQFGARNGSGALILIMLCMIIRSSDAREADRNLGRLIRAPMLAEVLPGLPAVQVFRHLKSQPLPRNRVFPDWFRRPMDWLAGVCLGWTIGMNLFYFQEARFIFMALSIGVLSYVLIELMGGIARLRPRSREGRRK